MHDVDLAGLATQRAGVTRRNREAIQDRPLRVDVQTHARNRAPGREARKLHVVTSGGEALAEPRDGIGRSGRFLVDMRHDMDKLHPAIVP